MRRGFRREWKEAATQHARGFDSYSFPPSSFLPAGPYNWPRMPYPYLLGHRYPQWLHHRVYWYDVDLWLWFDWWNWALWFRLFQPGASPFRTQYLQPDIVGHTMLRFQRELRPWAADRGVQGRDVVIDIARGATR
jgi:hypothetical protein